MASRWFPKGLLHLIKGDITGGLDAADLKVAFVCIDSSVTNYYTFDATDEVIGDVLAAAIAATSEVFNATVEIVSDDIVKVDAADLNFPEVPAGDPVQAAIVYWESGAAETRYLIGYDETAEAKTPDNTDIALYWGADGVLRILTEPAA